MPSSGLASDPSGRFVVEGWHPDSGVFMTRPRYKTEEQAQAFLRAISAQITKTGIGLNGKSIYQVIELDHEEAVV